MPVRRFQIQCDDIPEIKIDVNNWASEYADNVKNLNDKVIGETIDLVWGPAEGDKTESISGRCGRKIVDELSIPGKPFAYGVVAARPNWTDYLLGIAKVVSLRSHDSQTQHGCVIADFDHRIIGVGYNGGPRAMANDKIPNTRPEKYPWMIHSEPNAIANANCSLRNIDATAYVTGPPCFNCILWMWQNYIEKVVCIKGYGWKKDEEEATLKAKFLAEVPMQINFVEPDLSWLNRAVSAPARV
jgi:dCMP deaminase